MPVFDADLALPVSRPVRSAGGGGRRSGSARGVGLAVAALVLLTAGVVVGGMVEPGPSASPSPSPQSTLVAACALARNVPEFGLGAIGNEQTYGGHFGYRYNRGDSSGSKDWVTPEVAGRGSVESGAVLEVRAANGACVDRVVAEYADASLDDLASEQQPLVSATVVPPSTSTTLGTLPDGEWVIRVTVYFETSVSGSGGQVIRLSYFRMRVGPGPFRTPEPSPTPERTPAVTPAVACGPAPVSAETVELLAVTAAADDPDVPGAAAGSEPALVDIELGGSVEIHVSGDACATSWDIRVVNIDNLETTERAAQLASDDPAYAAQNRWHLPVPVGDYVLVADLRFGAEVAVHREWKLAGLGFSFPEASLVGGDGTRVAVLPGCGLFVSLANGYAASESCGSIGYPGGLDVLRVPAWSPVVIEIPGWTVTTWSGSCGRVVDADGSDEFESMNGCWLGGYSVGVLASPPAPAQFLARPGEQVVQMGITASRDGDTFSVEMYGLVSGE